MTGPTRIPSESVRIAADRDAIWALFDDTDALSRVLPGCESLAEVAPGRYAAVLSTRAGFIHVRADATVEMMDVTRPTNLRLVIDGVPRGIGGTFHVSVPIELESVGPASTQVTYAVELELAGRIASLGGSMVRNSLHGLVGDLVRNVERELGGGARRG